MMSGCARGQGGGFWESRGRNPALGAFLSVTLIVALYQLVGSFSLLGYMALSAQAGDLENLKEFFKTLISRYKVPILASTICFEFLFFVGGTVLVFRKWHRGIIRDRFRFRLPALPDLGFAILGLAGLLPLSILAAELLFRAFPFLRELQASGENLYSFSNPAGCLLTVASICLTPALCEEFLFRGYLQGTASLKLKSPLSWILPGAFFALIHQNYFGLGALLIIGIYLAFLFETTKSIFPGMLVHFLYNGTLIFISNLARPPAWLFSSDELIRPTLVVAALPLAAVSTLFLYRRGMPKQ